MITRSSQAEVKRKETPYLFDSIEIDDIRDLDHIGTAGMPDQQAEVVGTENTENDNIFEFAEDELSEIQGDTKSSDFASEMKEDVGISIDETTAELWAFAFDVGLGTVCAAIAGDEDDDKYRMKKKDYDKYEKICVKFFSSVEHSLSPETMFFVITLSFSFSSLKIAMQEKKKKKNAKMEVVAEGEKAQLLNMQVLKENETLKARLDSYEIREAAAGMGSKNNSNNGFIGVAKPQETNEDIQRKNKISEELLKLDRGNFNIDANGYFENDKKSVYIPVGERTEKAPVEIIALKKKGLSNKEINKMIKRLRNGKR